MRNIPKRIPTTIVDRAVNYLNYIADEIIQLEAEYKRPLDAERLNKGFRLVTLVLSHKCEIESHRPQKPTSPVLLRPQRLPELCRFSVRTA